MPTEKLKRLCEIIIERKKNDYREKVDGFKNLITNIVLENKPGLIDYKSKEFLIKDSVIASFLDNNGVKLEFKHNFGSEKVYVYVVLK